MKKIHFKIIITAFMVFSLSELLYSQGPNLIRGTVKNGPEGNPVDEATVTIQGTGFSGISGSTGEYVIDLSDNTFDEITLVLEYAGIEKNFTFTSGTNWMNFWTNPPDLPSDFDDNYYKTVLIGDQTWMAENLQTTHYQTTGEPITYYPDLIPPMNTPPPEGAYYIYNEDFNIGETYGKLYNWYAVEDSRNMCPAGWHVPSYQDYSKLFTSLGYEEGVLPPGGNYLKEPGTLHWNSNTGATDDFEFTALPGGEYSALLLGSWDFRYLGSTGSFWSSGIYSTTNPMDPTEVRALTLTATSSALSLDLRQRNDGLSVRCVMDDTPPEVSTRTVMDITANSAIAHGEVVSQGSAPVTVKGFCWSISPDDPDLSDNHIEEGSGSVYFSSTLSDLNPNTAYNVRAYATNSIGTAYGEISTFITEELPVPTVVTTIQDYNPDEEEPIYGSLRYALDYANKTEGVQEITFNIPEGPYTIQPLTPLLPITDPIIIDGYSQPGSSPATNTNPATILIEINGEFTPGETNTGLYLNAGESTISGLAIKNFVYGISLYDEGNNTIEGNFITVNSTGIYIYSSDNTIGGITPAARNIISGNMNGIRIENVNPGGPPGWARNRIVGNYIGVDKTGSPLGNDGAGILIIDSPENIIGGQTISERNIISGNNDGISIGYYRYDSPFQNKIEGNYIGTNVGGTAPIGNYRGITLEVPGNFVGGSLPGAGNLISGNLNAGISMNARANGNVIQGNLIGTDYSGSIPLPNGNYGIHIQGGSNNQIGGTVAMARNIISGNSPGGIYISQGTLLSIPVIAEGNVIQGNYIGLAANGDDPLGNQKIGLQISNSSGNLIGGDGDGEGNVISANGSDTDYDHGIIIEFVDSEDGNNIQGNLLGTDYTGMKARGNAACGIFLYHSSHTSILDNLISGNHDGIGIYKEDENDENFSDSKYDLVSDNNVVEKNRIGIKADGSLLGNTRNGIFIRRAKFNTIGGTLPEKANIIGGSGKPGIILLDFGTTDNKVIGNYIGTNETGHAILPNNMGVALNEGADNNLIEGNVISNCTGVGLNFWRVNANHVYRNLIAENEGLAIYLNGNDNIFGGSEDEKRNIIYGPTSGIVITPESTGNRIENNFLGTDESGLICKNTVPEVEDEFLPDGICIGGTDNIILNNLISGYGGEGIDIAKSETTEIIPSNNLIEGNRIGLNDNETDFIPNRNGVYLFQAENNTIVRNKIAGNNSNGILVGPLNSTITNNNLISENSIFNNGELGIALGTGVTLNDLGDVDDGPNGFQNYPVLESFSFATTGEGGITISGYLDGKPEEDYTLQFFVSEVPDKTGYGEGQTYLGSWPLTVTEYGNTEFTAEFTTYNSIYGDVITATATDSEGNTSEFSAAIGGLQNQIQPDLPLSYNINNEDIGNEDIGLIPFEEIEMAIVNAFNSWAEIETSSVSEFIYDGETDGGTTEKYASANDGMNLVSFKDDRFPFSPGVLAVCAKTLKIEEGETDEKEAHILDADIVFNPYYVTDPALNFGIEGDSDYDGFFDIQSVATHEIGHALGLIHSGVYNSVMWFEIGPGTENRTLKQDDISWLSYRYPSATYQGIYGSISGHITYGENDDDVAGSIVLAIDPVENVPVVHAYSDAEGNFVIPGLLPDEDGYNVYITPLDGDVYGRPLRPGNISPYIYYNTIYTDYPGEYYDDNESAEEEDRLDKVEVTVAISGEPQPIEIITNVADPTVISVSPDNGSSNVSVLPNILITFSEPVDMSTFNIESCYLTEAGSSTPIGGAYQPEGFDDNSDKVLFIPEGEEGLNYGTNYTLHLIAPQDENQPGIRDLWDNPLDADPETDGTEPEYQSTFTTLMKDNDSPAILDISPDNGATNVFLEDEILITFSEPMNKSSVESNFSLNDGADNITFETNWYEYSSLTLTPDALIEGTTYSLSWTGGATDIAGNGLKPGSISFSTIPNAPPTITYLEPGTDLTTNVSVETSIVVDFSEPMDPDSFQDNFILHEGDDVNGSEVPGELEFLNNNSQVVFRPYDALEFSSDDPQYYTLELKEYICDVSNEVDYLAPVSTTFSTASVPQQPHISSIRPFSGVPTSILRIDGYGFDNDIPDNRVTFTSEDPDIDVQALITDASPTSLTVEVPAGASSGPVHVFVYKLVDVVEGKDVYDWVEDDQYPDSWITYFYYIPPTDAAYQAYANTNTGSQSRSATLSYNGATAYVTNSGENTVSVIENLDENPKEVTPRIQVGTTPMMIALNPLGTSAYVTNYNSHDVSVIDLTEGETKYDIVETIDVPPYPYGIASAGNDIFVANSAFVSIINIDPESGGFDHIVANINTGSRNRDVDVTADGGTLVVTGDNGVNIIELIKTELGFDYAITNVNPNTKTRDVSVSHDNGTAIITTEDGNIFLVGIVRGTSSFGNAYYNYNPKSKAGDGTTSFDGQYYFVTNPDDNQVTIYELLYEEGGTGYNSSSSRRATLKEFMVVPTGMRPEGICNDYDDNKFITANFDSDDITLVIHIAFEDKNVNNLLSELMENINDLINSEGFNENLGIPLLIRINEVFKDIESEKTKSAINSLKTFIRIIEGYDRGGLFPSDDTYTADNLIKAAERIIYLLQHPESKSEQDELAFTDNDQLKSDLISESKLGVIYPNPFSESVTINYEIAESEKGYEKVQINIYDVTGRLVGTAVDNDLQPGQYSTVWNGQYNNGGHVPMGTYFVRFRTDSKVDIKQIMLVR